ncbi:YjzC family protein [Arthrobacter sp. UYEF3]|uniref:YjzC family protein n=1 Tax=Arthrobacter sp. UYEF3 TaxID=1756365 RepID=UPI0033945134
MANLKPGRDAPLSGQYEIVGPRGGRTGDERTAIRGRTLPPTPKSGQGYVPVDPTRNGAGRDNKR